ncbi:MAG: hypothetical protein JKY65_06845, partial [Planctomycetes bacterium]|nr:hypothetical protein [Planctomycetota bacterium]
MPWRFSPFWALALTATALSPLSLRAAPPPPGPRLVSRSLLDPSLLAPGPGGGGSEEPSSPSSSSGEEGRYGLNEAAEGAEAPTTPLELPLDVAAALARAISGSGAGGGGEGGAEPSLPDPLWKTAQTSGLEEALREVAELKAAAQSGDRAARARLDQLGRALAQAQGSLRSK